MYLKALNPEACLKWLIADVCPDLQEQLKDWETATLVQVIALYQERVKTGKELCQLLINLHAGPSLYEKDDVDKWITRQARGLLDAVVPQLEALDEFSGQAIGSAVKAFCKEHNAKLVEIAQPLRIALTGGASSPGVFELLAVLGKQESIKRVHALQRYLELH